MAKTSRVIVNGSTSTTALADPVPTTTLPTTGIETVPEEARSVMLYFGGSNAGNEDYGFQVVLWRRAQDQLAVDSSMADNFLYVPELVAEGIATLGTLTMADADADGVATQLYADTITNTQTVARPDVLTFSPADNMQGWVYVELDDAVAIEVEVQCDAGSNEAASAYVLGRFSEATHPFFLNRLIGGVNDTTTDSLQGKLGEDEEMSDASLHDMLGDWSGAYNGTAYAANIKAALDKTAWRVATASVTTAPSDLGAIYGQTAGVIEMKTFGVVETGITGTLAETLTALVGSTTVIAATTATDLDDDEIWHDASPDANVEDASQIESYLINGPRNVTLQQSGNDAWDTGELTMYVLWRPISSDGAFTPSDITP